MKMMMLKMIVMKMMVQCAASISKQREDINTRTREFQCTLLRLLLALQSTQHRRAQRQRAPDLGCDLTQTAASLVASVAPKRAGRTGRDPP